MKPEYQNWHVETATSSRTDDIEYFIRRDGDSVAVASDIINPETEQPSKEIADLLCAAPDLLAALNDMLSILDDAGAEDEETWQPGQRWIFTEDKISAKNRITSARAAIAKAEGKA